MTAEKQIELASAEPRWTRKKQETRRRIVDAAMRLFAERGFAATRIEDIAEAADISKRSFFDYFAAKEDVIVGWQATFEGELTAALQTRPAAEPLWAAVEGALGDALEGLSPTVCAAHAQLAAEAAPLAARDQLKYVRLEAAFAEALHTRPDGRDDPLKAQLVAMCAVGALRIAVNEINEPGNRDAMIAALRRNFKLLRQALTIDEQRSARADRKSSDTGHD